MRYHSGTEWNALPKSDKSRDVYLRVDQLGEAGVDSKLHVKSTPVAAVEA